jgi:hypothetical protein
MRRFKHNPSTILPFITDELNGAKSFHLLLKYYHFYSSESLPNQLAISSRLYFANSIANGPLIYGQSGEPCLLCLSAVLLPLLHSFGLHENLLLYGCCVSMVVSCVRFSYYSGGDRGL